MELAGGSKVERVVLYGTEQAGDLGTRRRAVTVLLSLVAAAAFVALLGLVWPDAPRGDVGLLEPLPQYHGGSSWASEKLSHLSSTDAGWLGTGDDVQLRPLPSYNPDDDAERDESAETNLDDEGDDIKDLVDTDFAFKPSLAQKSGSHGHGSTHHHENPDVKNLGSLSREVLGKDVQSPKEKEKEEQKRIFAKAARTEARLKKSLHDEAKAKKSKHSAAHTVQATSGLESLSSYHEGKVHKAEAQLAALEKQVRAQETAIKSKDETNIKALKMEEQEAKKDEAQRLASLEAHEHSMSELLHKRIEHLRHERETHDRQAAKAVRMQQKLQAQMAAVKEADSKKLAALRKKLTTLGGKAPAPHAQSAPTGKTGRVMSAGNDDKFVKVAKGAQMAAARTQQLSEQPPHKALTAALAAKKTARMDAEANKVAHMLETSSKLQQTAIRDAANEAKLIQQSFKQYFHQSIGSTGATKLAQTRDKTEAPAKAALPLQAGPRAANFASPANDGRQQARGAAGKGANAASKAAAPAAAGASTSFDSSDEKPRGFASRLDAGAYYARAPATHTWSALGKEIESDARAASLESPALRQAAIRKMKALKESVTNDLDLLESPAGF